MGCVESKAKSEESKDEKKENENLQDKLIYNKQVEIIHSNWEIVSKDLQWHGMTLFRR